MCRTFTITYLLCLHPKTDNKPCPTQRSFFSSFRSKCEIIKTEVSVNDFCSSCRFFWDSYAILGDARRELVNSFRILNACHGPLTPMLGSDGGITFRMGAESRVSGEKLIMMNEIDDDVIRLSMLNAASWVLKDDEAPMPAAPTRSRRASASSTLTIWPGAVEDTAVERDEFGNEIDMENLSAPQAAHLARHGLVDPDEFELVNLDEDLPGPVHGEGFEHQRVIRPIAPLETRLPHRGG